jgi:hypothetical protein
LDSRGSIGSSVRRLFSADDVLAGRSVTGWRASDKGKLSSGDIDSGRRPTARRIRGVSLRSGRVLRQVLQTFS